MLTAEQNKEVQIFNAAGTLLKSKADHPDFDPSFLKGFMRGLSNQSIAEAISALGQEPRPPRGKKLAGSGLWRIRVGQYRVVYNIDDEEHLVTVVRVAKRTEDTYKRL